MGRSYHFSKQITEAQSKKILRQMKGIEDVRHVEISKDHKYLKVMTIDEEFTDVMEQAVNICSKNVRGLELSFAQFILE